MTIDEASTSEIAHIPPGESVPRRRIARKMKQAVIPGSGPIAAPSPVVAAPEREAVYINEIRVPGKADTYRVYRYEDAGAGGKHETMAILDEARGEHVLDFKVKENPPDWQDVLHLWGSGIYRLAWFGWSREQKRMRQHGLTVVKVWDHPKFPPLPAVRRVSPPEPQPAPPPVAAAPPAASPNAMVDVIRSLAGGEGGTINAGIAIALISMSAAMQEQQLAALEERQRRWRLEDESRAREREDEHRRRLERERAFADEDRKRVDDFYRRASERPADPAIARLESSVRDLAAELDERDDDRDAAAPEKSLADQMMEGALPIILAKFAGSAGALEPSKP